MCDISIALEAAADHGLTKFEADEAVARATAAVALWRDEATRLHIPKAEQDLMTTAFESVA